MATKTMRSEEARIKMRDILDEVYAGNTEVVIERYNRPTAVVVSYSQWQAWKRQRQQHIAAARKEAAEGNVLTQAEVRAELEAKGLL